MPLIDPKTRFALRRQALIKLEPSASDQVLSAAALARATDGLRRQLKGLERLLRPESKAIVFSWYWDGRNKNVWAETGVAARCKLPGGYSRTDLALAGLGVELDAKLETEEVAFSIQLDAGLAGPRERSSVAAELAMLNLYSALAEALEATPVLHGRSVFLHRHERWPVLVRSAAPLPKKAAPKVRKARPKSKAKLVSTDPPKKEVPSAMKRFMATAMLPPSLYSMRYTLESAERLPPPQSQFRQASLLVLLDPEREPWLTLRLSAGNLRGSRRSKTTELATRDGEKLAASPDGIHLGSTTVTGLPEWLKHAADQLGVTWDRGTLSFTRKDGPLMRDIAKFERWLWGR